jgi:hypothetical protein
MPEGGQPKPIGNALTIHFPTQHPDLDQPDQRLFDDQFRHWAMAVAEARSLDGDRLEGDAVGFHRGEQAMAKGRTAQGAFGTLARPAGIGEGIGGGSSRHSADRDGNIPIIADYRATGGAVVTGVLTAAGATPTVLIRACITLLTIGAETVEP